MSMYVHMCHVAAYSHTYKVLVVVPKAKEGGVGNWLIICYCITRYHMMHVIISPDVTWCMLLYHQMSPDVCMIMCICVWAHVNIWYLHFLSFPLSLSSLPVSLSSPPLPPSLPFATADLFSSRCGSQLPASHSLWRRLYLRCPSVPKWCMRAASVPHLTLC